MIRKRGDSLQVKVYAGVDPATGRERHLYRTTKAGRKVAERIERELLRDVDRGKTRDERMTVAELLARWIAHVDPGLARGTAEGYRRIIDKTLTPTIGNLPIDKLGAVDLDTVYGALLRRGLSASAVHQVHVVAKGACDQAIKWNLLRFNPATAASPPPVRRRDMRVPATEEIERLSIWTAEHDPDTATLVRLAASTGARRGELVALRWTDVDLDGHELRITHALAAVKGAVIEKETKGRRARALAIDEQTVVLLRAHRRREIEKALRYGVPLELDAPVLTGEPGRPWYPDTATARFGAARRATHVTARLHDLRHWHASQLLAAGVPITTVSARLGHASTKMTLDVYGHMIEAHDTGAATAIAALLDG